ncbi:MAG: peptidoglycan glycosyltransferase, partial [Myxococcota bacterium]
MLDIQRRGLVISGAAGLLTGLVLALVIWDETPPPRQAASPVATPVAAAPASAVAPQPGPALVDTAVPTELLNVAAAGKVDGRMVQDLGGGKLVEYTVMPELQKRASDILSEAEVPYGAMVALEPKTGRILGYVQHSEHRPDISNIAGLAIPPSASVFKVITAAALIEHARIAPDYEVCFNGGRRGFKLPQLEDDPRRDTRCHSLTEALGRSSNIVFGKLADRHLNADILDQYARKFGWGKNIPFELPLEPSAAKFEQDRLTLAQTAAGFYNTQMSPVHAALIAGSIANDGLMMSPHIIEKYSAGGRTIQTRSANPLGRVIKKRTARVLGEMMVATTELGTARSYFSKRARSLKGIRVAAKTGSLSARDYNDERHHFSWWIGFAPAENPTIAVAALVVNVG